MVLLTSDHLTKVGMLYLFQRTEAQLKKCWDNLKTRRKQILALPKTRTDSDWGWTLHTGLDQHIQHTRGNRGGFAGLYRYGVAGGYRQRF